MQTPTTTNTADATGPRALRVEAVAERYDLSVARVYELCRHGLIPHIRIGRQIRFDVARLEEWEAAGGAALPGGWRQEAV